jgi:hypothetical protein
MVDLAIFFVHAGLNLMLVTVVRASFLEECCSPAMGGAVDDGWKERSSVYVTHRRRRVGWRLHSENMGDILQR